MREKYYSLIEELIRKHRKFEGLEAILDDIIEDVLQHSEVVIGNISNETVIYSYLEKVVSTSIITVPKKLDFHPEISHRVITSSPIVNDIIHKSVNNELVDKMINGSFSATKSSEEEQDLTYEGLNEQVELLEVEDTSVETNDVLEQTDFDNLTVLDSDLQIDEPSEVAFTPDVQLVDSEDEETINSIDVDIKEEATEFNEEEIELTSVTNVYEDNDGSIQYSRDIEQLDENVEEIDYSNLIPQDENSDSALAHIEENQRIVQSDEFVSLESFVDDVEEDSKELFVEDAVDTTMGEEKLEEQVIEEIVSLESQIDDDKSEFEEPINSENLEKLTFNSDLESVIELQQGDELLENSDLLNEETATSDELEAPDYNLFGFESADNIIEQQDINEIQEGLLDLNKKRPELNIVKIFELKYKENSSVSQIALSLEMSEENVLEALNEIVALV